MDVDYWHQMLGAPIRDKSWEYGPDVLGAVNEGNLDAAFELWNSYMREPYREETIREVFPDAYLADDCKGAKGKELWAVACGEKEAVGRYGGDRQMVDVPTPVSRLASAELWNYIRRDPHVVTEEMLEETSGDIPRLQVAKVLMIQALEGGDLTKAEGYALMFDGRSRERVDAMRMILKHHAVLGNESAFEEHLKKCKPKTRPEKIEELSRALCTEIARSEGLDNGKAAYDRWGHGGSTSIVGFAMKHTDMTVAQLVELIEEELSGNPAMACYFYQDLIRSERGAGASSGRAPGKE